MTRLRWWLARRIAPVRIVADLFDEGEHGAFVIFRGEDGWTAGWRVERLRIKSSMRLRSLDYDSTEPFGFPLRGSFTRFVGTLR